METISTNSNPVRSTFLTVLCVLTFIGSGWGVIGAVRSYVGADTISSVANGAMDQAKENMGDQAPNFLKQLMSSVSAGLSPESIRKSAIFKLVSCLLTLLGAIMMWNLKKTGFYLYIAGTVVMAIGPLVVFGNGMPGMMGAGGAGFIGVVFIAMYAANLKDMQS